MVSDPVREAQEATYRYGLTPEQFWSLTPHETQAWVSARVETLKAEHRGRAWLAWHIAAFGRSKRLPSLQIMMERLGGAVAKQQTPEQMMKVAEAITIALGGKDIREKEQ